MGLLRVRSGGFKSMRICPSFAPSSPRSWHYLRTLYRHPCVSFRPSLILSFTITRAFTNTYNDDKTRFGDPAKSAYKVVEVKNLDSWQTVLLAHARNVQPPNFKKHKVPPAWVNAVLGNGRARTIVYLLDSAMDHPRSTNIIYGYWLPCNVETDPEPNILVLWEHCIVVAKMSRQHLMVVRWGSADSSCWCPTHQMSKKHSGPRKWNIDCGNQPSQNLRFCSDWWWPNSPQTDTHTTF